MLGQLAYLSYADQLYGNSVIKQQLLSDTSFLKISQNLNEREIFDKIIIHYLEEAELTLSLIKDLTFTKESVLLEIGGGTNEAHHKNMVRDLRKLHEKIL